MCWCSSVVFSVNSFMNHVIDMQWIVFVAPVVVLLQDRNRKRKKASNNETLLSFLSCHSIIVLLGVCACERTVEFRFFLSARLRVCGCVYSQVSRVDRKDSRVLATLFDVAIDDCAKRPHKTHRFDLCLFSFSLIQFLLFFVVVLWIFAEKQTNKQE